MLFGQFGEHWYKSNEEVRHRFKRLMDDLLRTTKLEKWESNSEVQQLLSDIIGRVNEVHGRWSGNVSITNDCLNNLERDVLETLGKRNELSK